MRFLHWPDAPAKGDAADFVEQLEREGLDVEAIRRRVEDLIAAATTSLQARSRLRLVTFDQIPVEPVEWLWSDRIALGKLSLLVGDPDVGKSLVTIDLAARLTRGSTMPGVPRMEPPIEGDVLIFGCEDGAEDTVRPRIEAAGAIPKRVRTMDPRPVANSAIPDWLDLGRDMDALDADLTSFAGIRLVILDPLSAFLGSANAYRDHEVRPLLGQLAQLASRHRVAIVAMLHLNKSELMSKHRVLGSVAFVAAARTVLLVAEDPKQKGRRILVPIKNNLSADRSALAFRIESDSLDRPTLVWEREPFECSPDALLASTKPEAGDGKLGDAIAFLEAELQDGSRPTADVERTAMEGGISRRTLQRARDQLGVVASRARGCWVLSLRSATSELKAASAPESEGGGLGLAAESTRARTLDASADDARRNGAMLGDGDG